MMRHLLLCGAVSLVIVGTAQAQQRDQARLIFNVSAGFIGGTQLWRVDRQPIYDDNFGEPLIDTLSIRRRIRSTLTVSARGIFFQNAHFGVFGEGILLGLGFDDSCARVHATTSTRNQQVCNSLDNAETPASAVQVGGGVMYRVASQKTISPYVRAAVGIALSTRSPLKSTGQYISPSLAENVDVDVYRDDSNSRIYLTGGLGAGFTAQVGRGYQLRWELRDNMVRMPTVAGPTVQEGLPPESTIRIRHLISLEVGFDVVLERRHGRRY